MTNDEFANRGQQNSQPNQLSYTIGANESPSEAIIKATAAFTNTNVLDLEPLYHTIDPDSIDGMFNSTDGNVESVEASFEFNGCNVEIHSKKVIIRKGRDQQ